MKSNLVLYIFSKKKWTWFLIIQHRFFKKAISYKVMMKHILAKLDTGNNSRRCIILRNDFFFSSNISKHFDISF